MSRITTSRQLLGLLLVLVPLLAVFGYMVARSGPLAPVPVTVAEVERKPLSPAIFGIGTVEARYRYRIGPIATGRLLQLHYDVGDEVRSGALLGEMDSVDFDQRLAANDAALEKARAGLAAATARESFARAERARYRKLLERQSVSRKEWEVRDQEYRVAAAEKEAARRELDALQANRAGLLEQQRNFRLFAPADGLVVRRHAEPGSTVAAGQTVLELIDPRSIWIHVRFDQSRAQGLAVGLPATLVLRSRPEERFSGEVVRIEPLADSVTEELIAKVAFRQLPRPLPPLGELVEVTVSLPGTEAGPVVPNAAVKQRRGRSGVWVAEEGAVRFRVVEIGVSDLEGQVQIRSGVETGERIVVYSPKELTPRSRIKVVSRLLEDGRG